MHIIKSLNTNSVWYGDRDQFIGETFSIDGSRFTPQSDKAKAFAEKHGVKYFVFLSAPLLEEVKSPKKR